VATHLVGSEEAAFPWTKYRNKGKREAKKVAPPYPLSLTSQLVMASSMILSFIFLYFITARGSIVAGFPATKCLCPTGDQPIVPIPISWVLVPSLVAPAASIIQIMCFLLTVTDLFKDVTGLLPVLILLITGGAPTVLW